MDVELAQDPSETRVDNAQKSHHGSTVCVNCEMYVPLLISSSGGEMLGEHGMY